MRGKQARASQEEQDQSALADTNRDDKLSRREVSNAAVKTIFAKFDSNQDGKPTFADWQQNDKTATKILFAGRDSNSDDHLTPDEARTCMSHHGAGFEAGQWKDVVGTNGREMGLALGCRIGKADVGKEKIRPVLNTGHVLPCGKPGNFPVCFMT
jgi:hypothetical protein